MPEKDTDPAPQDGTAERPAATLLERLATILTDGQREVIKRRFLEGSTPALEEVATSLGVSPSRASQLQRAALYAIRNKAGRETLDEVYAANPALANSLKHKP